ncbi:MAG: class 3 adenylate cyclase/CheY-like chemotaxis protein [Oceanicoccus sp.]|jgi:class 3 adenylate cyclase/CheY-like chemotaxis protein
MTTTPLSQQADAWIAHSERLSNNIAALNSQITSNLADRMISSEQQDLMKLIAAGEKLSTCRQAASAGERSDKRKIWHDLRNIIGTIIGYCELILEAPNCSTNIADPLQQLLADSHKLLDQGEQAEDTQPTDNIVASKGSTGTVLIVDDQAESREILRRYLQQGQHQVLEADGGKAMFSILKLQDIDLILLDLILPEMHGDELLQQLKADEVLRAIPVIVVSGNQDRERIIKCIEGGAEDYLFKPFNRVLLQARIRSSIERKRWHDKEELYRQELERNQRFIRSVFGRYVSEEIVSTILDDPDGLNLGGVQRKVTVLMADIRGFTTIAEQLPPQRVVRLLNNYLGTMSDIIMDHNGTVDEFIGDAILAIFGAPISRDDDSDRAIHCALAMQSAMTTINQRNKAEQLPEISMGISLNTGLVVAGNIGSEKRAKYGVVGHTVNQTARIEEHCEAGSILISEATLQDCKAMISIGESKTIQAKGILKAIKIFELIDSSTAPAQLNAAAPEQPGESM